MLDLAKKTQINFKVLFFVVLNLFLILSLLKKGDRFTEEECDELLRDAPIKNSQFDYVEFTRILKHGRKEEDSNQTL